MLLVVYKWSSRLPEDEEYTLRSQIRRSAISIPANIVEGSARAGHSEYLHFLHIALGSAAELHYLIDVAGRIDPALAQNGNSLPQACVPVRKQLAALIGGLRQSPSSG
jgi:four helix bundle protein